MIDRYTEIRVAGILPDNLELKPGDLVAVVDSPTQVVISKIAEILENRRDDLPVHQIEAIADLIAEDRERREKELEAFNNAR